MTTQMYVAADEIQEGDFIPGLDNAFVTEVFFDHDFSDSFGVRVGTVDGVLVTYDDADGEGGYLFLTAGTRVEIRRE